MENQQPQKINIKITDEIMMGKYANVMRVTSNK